MKWYYEYLTDDIDVTKFLNKLPEESALTAKIVIDRDPSNDYCSCWYKVYYFADKEYRF